MKHCATCGVEIKHGNYCTEHSREQKKLRNREYMKKYYKSLHTKSGPKTELIERRCLKCNRRFMAEGRFTRLCERCNKANQEVVDYGGICAIIR